MSDEGARHRLRIATRSSTLALWQANHVAGLIRNASEELTIELVEVSTQGDRDRQQVLASMGGQGVFTREVQAAVLEDRADLAVHSLKDLPTASEPGLILAGIPSRAPRFDALVLPQGTSISVWSDLPAGARIGTGSPRRRAQLLHPRPDLQFIDVRGNVETRLRKLDEGACEAIILAQAGLERLDLAHRVSLVLAPPIMYPAVGQAALGIECRADDGFALGLLQRISHKPTTAEVLAERACLATLRAGCHAPVGVLSRVEGDALHLMGVVLSVDGRQRFEFQATGSMADPADPTSLGTAVARGLLKQGAEKVLTAAN